MEIQGQREVAFQEAGQRPSQPAEWTGSASQPEEAAKGHSRLQWKRQECKKDQNAARNACSPNEWLVFPTWWLRVEPCVSDH